MKSLRANGRVRAREEPSGRRAFEAPPFAPEVLRSQSTNWHIWLTLSIVSVLLAAPSHVVSDAAAMPASHALAPVSGGTEVQRGLLRDVLRSLGGTQIKAIRLEASAGGVWLFMEPSRLERARANVSVRVRWDAYVTAYSFRKLSRARGLEPVAGFTVFGRPQAFRPRTSRLLSPFDRPKIVAPVARAVKISGARLIEFNLFRPAGPAFAVVVATPRPAFFIQRRLGAIIGSLVRVASRLEGFYVAVTDTSHSVVFAYGRVALPGLLTSTVYVRPDLEGCAKLLPIENEIGGNARCPRG